MSDKLPDLIDPLLFAERRSVLTGAIKIAAFERLSEMVLAKDGDVQVDVHFSKQGRQALVSGTIKAALELECQSCLQAMPWPIDVSFRLGVVASVQEADMLEIDCEPLLLDGETVSLIALIEDEILLALPDYPKHGYECVAKRSSKDADFDDQNQAETHNQFSVLAKLKKTGE